MFPVLYTKRLNDKNIKYALFAVTKKLLCKNNNNAYIISYIKFTI